MKKLEKLKINPERILKNDELISIRGGYGDDGTCGFKVFMDGLQVVECGVSRARAEYFATQFSGNWCCDSCSSSSYC